MVNKMGYTGIYFTGMHKEWDSTVDEGPALEICFSKSVLGENEERRLLLGLAMVLVILGMFIHTHMSKDEAWNYSKHEDVQHTLNEIICIQKNALQS